MIRIFAMAMLLLFAAVVRAEEAKKSAGSHEVAVVKFDWKDARAQTGWCRRRSTCPTAVGRFRS